MQLTAITFQEACAFIATQHRHHKPPQGWKFGVGAESDGRLIGVAMVGRPVARGLDNGRTVEVVRLCTDGTQNACSFLYSACARAAQNLGYERIITYILEEESGASLRATGWSLDAVVKGGSWSRAARPRSDEHPLGDKQRWMRVLA